MSIVAGALITAGGSILSGLFGRSSQKKATAGANAANAANTEELKRSNLEKEALAREVLTLSRAGTETPTGNITYDPVRNVFVETLSDGVQRILDENIFEQLMKFTDAQSQRELLRRHEERQREAGGTADSLLQQFQDRTASPIATTGGVLADERITQGTATNEFFDRLDEGFNMQLTRGGGGEDALARSATERGRALRGNAPTKTGAQERALNINTADQDAILNRFVSLGNFAAPSGTGLPTSSLPQGVSGGAGDLQRGAVNAGMTGIGNIANPNFQIPPVADLSTASFLGSAANVGGGLIDFFQTQNAIEELKRRNDIADRTAVGNTFTSPGGGGGGFNAGAGNPGR